MNSMALPNKSILVTAIFLINLFFSNLCFSVPNHNSDPDEWFSPGLRGIGAPTSFECPYVTALLIYSDVYFYGPADDNLYLIDAYYMSGSSLVHWGTYIRADSVTGAKAKLISGLIAAERVSYTSEYDGNKYVCHYSSPLFEKNAALGSYASF